MTPIELAGCVITDEQKRVLLLHRNTPKRKQLEIPGGKVKPNEKGMTHITAIREASEELGVVVGNLALLDSAQFGEDGITYTYDRYRADIISGVPQAMEPHIHDRLGYYDLLNPASLADEVVSDNVRHLIEALEFGYITL